MSYSTSHETVPDLTGNDRSSSGSDLILISAAPGENGQFGTAFLDHGDVKLRPQSAGSGAEPMDIAINNLQADNCETSSVAAMSVDCERSSGACSEASNGASANRFPAIMEAAIEENSNTGDLFRSENGSVSENSGRTSKASRKSRKPSRVITGNQSKSTTPTVDTSVVSTNSSAPNSPAVVQIPSDEITKEIPILTPSSNDPPITTSRPLAPPPHHFSGNGKIQVNLIPTSIGQNVLPRMVTTTSQITPVNNSILTAALQSAPPGPSMASAPGPPRRNTVKKMIEERQNNSLAQQSQVSLQKSQLIAALGQAQPEPISAPSHTIVSAASTATSNNNIPKLVIRPPAIATSLKTTPSVTLKLHQTPTVSQAFSSANQQHLITKPAVTGSVPPQMPPSLSSAQGPSSTPVMFQPHPNSSSITQTIDSLATKLQIHFPWVNSSSATTSVVAAVCSNKVVGNSFQCKICRASFALKSEFENHINRKSLVLRYLDDSKSKDEIVFYNKCALLTYFMEKKHIFNVSKLSVGYYLPPLPTSSSEEGSSGKAPPEQLPPKPSPSTKASVVSTEKDKKSSQPPANRPVEPTVKCLECDKELPYSMGLKKGAAITMEEHFQRFEGDILVCRKCDVPVTNPCQAAAHYRLHCASSTNTAQNRLTCPNCGLAAFEDLSSCLAHFCATCMAAKFLGFRCLLCAFVTRDVLSLYNHISSSHARSNAKIDCPYCKKDVGRINCVSTLISQIISHGLVDESCNFQPFSIQEICRHCSRLFQSGSVMRTHIDKAHANQVAKVSISSAPSYCALCRKNVPNSLATHVAEAHGTAGIAESNWRNNFHIVDWNYLTKFSPNCQAKICVVCGEIVESQEKLIDHLAAHCDRICAACFDVFEDQVSLYRHMLGGECPAAKKKLKRKSVEKGRKAVLSDSEKAGSAEMCQFSYTCFQCLKDNASTFNFETMNALDIHLRTAHFSDLRDSSVDVSRATPTGEESSAPSSSHSTPGRSSASKRSRQTEELMPFVCYACSHVAMSRGSLEAHERKCKEIQRMEQSGDEPPSSRASSVAMEQDNSRSSSSAVSSSLQRESGADKLASTAQTSSGSVLVEETSNASNPHNMNS